MNGAPRSQAANDCTSGAAAEWSEWANDTGGRKSAPNQVSLKKNKSSKRSGLKNARFSTACYRVTTNGILTTLASFAGTNGASPMAALTLGSDNAFYGTTFTGEGNSAAWGTIFRVTTNGNLTTFAVFTNTDGAYPAAGLTLGPDNAFYGTTLFGPVSADGTVFLVTTNGQLTTIASFTGAIGRQPDSALALGPHGDFYGVTTDDTINHKGTVFRVTTNGELSTLVRFSGTNGTAPRRSRLALGFDNAFYGTTYFGGASNLGTVFRVSTNGVLSSLVSFVGTNGANPEAELTPSGDGGFYGTTRLGGKANKGTVYRVTTNGVLTTLVSFESSNGAIPEAAVTVGPEGALYGTTLFGGSNSNGTIYRVLLNPRIMGISNGPDGMTITVNVLPERSYTLESTGALFPADWKPVASTNTGTSDIVRLVDKTTVNHAARFFRIRSP